MSLYFDTSALVPAYVPESRTEKATAFLAETETVHVSRLTEVEFHSALALKFRAGQMRRKDAEHVAKIFSDHLASGVYARLQVPGEVFDLSLSYLRRFTTSLRALDALHLACCGHYSLVLLTADKEMAKSAKSLGIRCELI
ncbi:MAG: type II toxin-antitoxin system VapC family toxin [Nitrospirae bacterium]|nr:type II toxin-antitoxin system VapC family toxin [Nitrospirota bacterium]